MFHHFRKFPSFIFHDFRVIVHFRKNSVLLPVRVPIHHCRMFLCCFLMFRFFRISPSFIFHVRFISGIFRRSYFIISGLLCICEMFRLVSISLPSPSLPDVRSFLFCMFPYFRKFPSCISHHFRFNSGLFRRHISGTFRHSYFIISASFPDYSVVLFLEVSVLHISSFPFHFRIIPLWPSASFLIWACFV